jgi:exopolysaccharide biosynthesis polyprenyl glycosylphosphotransferase
MKNNASLLYSFFLLVGDAASLLTAFVGAYILRVTYGDRPIIAPIPARTYFVSVLLIVPFWLLLFGLLGLYSRSTYDKRFNELGRLLLGSFIGLLLITGIAYFSNHPLFPAKLVPVYGFVLTFVLLVLFRTLARFVRRILFAYGHGVSNVLIVGNTELTQELIDWLAEPRRSGYKIVGIVGESEKTHSHVRHFDTFDEAVKALGTNKIHSIMQTELFPGSTKNNEILTFAQTHHVAYRFIPGNMELFVGNIDVELFQSSIPMIAVHQTALVGWGRVVKRLFDFFVALVLCIILSPVLLIVALLNFVYTGNVFFRQMRLTRFDNKFRVFKFQTHSKEYSGLSPEQAFTKMGKPELIKEYRDNGDFLPDDPRVTAFGNFLRKTSLDELPQLFNVLKGDISLVGPRALVPEELEQYAKKHTILSVKSGLTGLAQVSGRKNISFDERRKLDTYYVQNWSFWMDLMILVKTIRVIFSGEGAK